MRRRKLLRSLGGAGVGVALVPFGTGAGVPGGERGDPLPAVVTPTPEDDGFDDEVVEAARQVGLDVRDSVVVFDDGEGTWDATGWFLREHLLVTATHLYLEGGPERAWTLDGETAGIRLLDRTEFGPHGDDVAALRTDVEGPPIPTGSTRELREGQPLVQVGNPKGVGNWVIALGRYRGSPASTDDIRSSLPPRRGFSGSPVVTLDGRVVGMHTSQVGSHSGRDDPPPDPDTETQPVYGPHDPAVLGQHEPIETILRYVEEWTGG